MSVFEHPEFANHEDVIFHHDPETGLRAIIAIHDTRLGPALGGCRMWAYDTAAAALTDVLRLSRGMTYKAAMARLPFGGGKSVVLGDARRDKSPALMRAMGRAVERLGGRYIVAEDVGVGAGDVAEMARETNHVAGLADESGGGDPSPATAYGVFVAMQAAVAERMRRNSLDGVRVAVQGLGHVGRDLCDRLAAAGAELTIADINARAVERVADRHQARVADPAEIHAADVDVYAPCALGGVLNDASIPQLSARVVAGSANNQLAAPRHGAVLAARDVLYAPDYVANAGGIVNIAHEPWCAGRPYDRDAAMAHVALIGETVAEVFAEARRAHASTALAADRIAERRLAAAA